jgi:hypothetical protein
MARRAAPLVLAGLALLLAAAALGLSLRRTTQGPRRLLELAPPQSYTARQPIPYTLDDFELMKLDDDSFVALYMYPPGFFGHTQGCTIRWHPETTFHATQYPNGATPGPSGQGVEVSAVGLWDEGCGGSKWDVAGHKLFGPAPGDLDRFPITVRDGRVWVDTRHLSCAAGHPCERVHKAGA